MQVRRVLTGRGYGCFTTIPLGQPNWQPFGNPSGPVPVVAISSVQQRLVTFGDSEGSSESADVETDRLIHGLYLTHTGAFVPGVGGRSDEQLLVPCPDCAGPGEVRYWLGERLVDRYLAFVAGRSRPDTLQVMAFDLKVFFSVGAKARPRSPPPMCLTSWPISAVTAAWSGWLMGSWGCRRWTIARRLSFVSGLHAYLVAQGMRRCGSIRYRVAC